MEMEETLEWRGNRKKEKNYERLQETCDVRGKGEKRAVVSRVGK